MIEELKNIAINLPTEDIWQRFFSKVDIKEISECWEWQANKTEHGYGRFAGPWVSDKAHRVLMIWLYGRLPREVVCDHLCHNRACVNPRHINLTTIPKNGRRGAGQTYDYVDMHCKHGHLWTPETVFYRISDRGYKVRQCRICDRMRSKAGKAKRKARRMELLTILSL